MNNKIVLTATAIILGLVGLAWSIFPANFVEFWEIEAGSNATYLGNRMGTLLLALGVTAWLLRNAPNTPTLRKFMIGALIALLATVIQSVYGVVVLGYNTLMPAIGETILSFGYIWVLFIKPEPVIK
jgi:uncharacterized BrkB/YihY/UPF0761 family membrane protein